MKPPKAKNIRNFSKQNEALCLQSSKMNRAKLTGPIKQETADRKNQDEALTICNDKAAHMLQLWKWIEQKRHVKCYPPAAVECHLPSRRYKLSET